MPFKIFCASFLLYHSVIRPIIIQSLDLPKLSITFSKVIQFWFSVIFQWWKWFFFIHMTITNTRQTFHNVRNDFYKRQFSVLAAHSQSWKLNNWITVEDTSMTSQFHKKHLPRFCYLTCLSLKNYLISKLWLAIIEVI